MVKRDHADENFPYHDEKKKWMKIPAKSLW